MQQKLKIIHSQLHPICHNVENNSPSKAMPPDALGPINPLPIIFNRRQNAQTLHSFDNRDRNATK